MALPNTYQKVEYIQSSGTQYIDTLHNHGTNTKFEIKFAFQTMTTEWNALCGARTNYMSNDDMDFFVHYRNSAYTMRYGCGGSMNDTWVSVSLDTPYVATLTKDAATLGGTTTSLSTNLTSCSYNDWVFGVCNSGTQVDNLVKAKVYYFKIWDNDVLVRDFVPCYRKSDSVIGLYDLVNDVFYTNNGTGTFTKGPDVLPPTGYKIQRIYIGDHNLVWPSIQAYELYYDLKGGNLADLQAAGFDGIAVNGGYQFTSDGLQQTSTSNDKGVSVYKTGLDLTNAKKITIRSLGYWYRGSWSNGKDVALIQSESFTANNDRPSVRYPRRMGNIVPNTNSASYCNQGIYYTNSSGTETAISQTSITTIQSGDTTLELILDLENKTVNFTHSGANNNSWNATLTDAQITEIRGMKSAVWNWGRGYHTYDSYERLKEVYLKIEY